jgi:hypothetical protein
VSSWTKAEPTEIPERLDIDTQTGDVSLIDSDGETIETSNKNPQIRDTMAALQRVTAALSDIAQEFVSTTMSIEQTVSSGEISAALTMAESPLYANIRDWARTFAGGMHRMDPTVPSWDEMSISQQKTLHAGIRALIDSGMCIVPQELVRYVRENASDVAK